MFTFPVSPRARIVRDLSQGTAAGNAGNTYLNECVCVFNISVEDTDGFRLALTHKE